MALGSLDQAAASGAGVGVGGDDLRVGGAGGVVRPGSAGAGLEGIGASQKTGGEGVGAAQKVAGPRGNANATVESQRGGKVGNASGVIARMKAGFRNCYQKGLNENPDAQGSIRLTIQIGPGGEVSNVSASASGICRQPSSPAFRRVRAPVSSIPPMAAAPRSSCRSPS